YVNMQVTSIVDWYNGNWKDILYKIGVVAELAQAGTQGIFFDPEGNNKGATFSSSQQLSGHSYLEMWNQVYFQGTQVGAAIVTGNLGADGNLPGMKNKHFMVTKWTSLLPPT